jgi:hypothetical protein
MVCLWFVVITPVYLNIKSPTIYTVRDINKGTFPRDATQQGLQGTQQGFQVSTTRLLGKCSTAGTAKGGKVLLLNPWI